MLVFENGFNFHKCSIFFWNNSISQSSGLWILFEVKYSVSWWLCREHYFQPFNKKSMLCLKKNVRRKQFMPNHWDLTCTTIWDILSLTFWVMLKENYLLKRCSSQIIGIYMEKQKTLWEARIYISAIEKTVPEILFWTQSYIRSLAVVMMRHPGVCMEFAQTWGERKNKQTKKQS